MNNNKLESVITELVKYDAKPYQEEWDELTVALVEIYQQNKEKGEEEQKDGK